MKILEIRNTTYGEVAYVYDEEIGKVLKLLIEDYTGYNEPIEERPRRTPRRNVSQREIPENIVEETEKPEPKNIRPRIAPKSIIPPHLRGVMIPPDQPGAAVERREI